MKRACFYILLVLLKLNIYGQEVNGEILSQDNNLTVLRVWGTHEDRGYAAGYFLAEQIIDLYENFIIPNFGTYLPYAKTLIKDPLHFSISEEYIDEAKAMITGIIDAGYEDEITTMNIDFSDILVANSFLDIANLSVINLNIRNGCSSLISWGNATTGTGLNGKSIITRHMDWNDIDAIIRNQVIVIHLPEEEDEQPWLLIGFAGQISVLSGFNLSGLAVMQHMLADDSSNGSLFKAYEPIWFTLRKIIEKKDFNNDEAVNTKDILDGILENHNGYGNGYIVAGLAPATSANDSLIAIIAELSPSIPYTSVRYNTYDDNIPGDNLYAANFSISRNNAQNYCMRYDSIVKYIGGGTGIGDDESWDLMLNHSSTCAFGGPGNIQFMQYIPEDKTLKLSVHLNDGTQACENAPMIFDTDELFSVEPPTSTDIPDIMSVIKVYPNPFLTNTIIEVNKVLPNNYTLNIFSIDGRLVKQMDMENPTVEIYNLNSGIYIIGLYKNGKLIDKKKLIAL